MRVRQLRGTNLRLGQRSGLEIQGLDELAKVMRRMDERLARNVLRGAPNAAAKLAVQQMRAAVPRNTGTLRRAIKHRARRRQDGTPGAQIYVERGASAKADGFYWRFLEFGTRYIPRRAFMRDTLYRLSSSGGLLRAMADYIRARWARAVAKARKR